LQLSKRLGRFGVNSRGSGVFLATLDLFRFVPFRLNRLAAEVSAALSGEYQQRYGLDIPEWRVLATLGFRNDACSAQYIAHCTRTHKSSISRAVTALMTWQLVERVENEDDRREFQLRMTRKGKARMRASFATQASSFRDGPKDQTSDVQLHIGESLDSGFDASRRPGMTGMIQARSICFAITGK